MELNTTKEANVKTAKVVIDAATLLCPYCQEAITDPGNVKTGTLPQRHDCEVKRTFPDHVHAAYQAVCDICGNVGQLQPRHADAYAIADRHFEQGGFERRGA